MLWQLIGIAAACLTSFAFIPQVIKMRTTKSAKDVSLITMLQLSLGSGFWIAYGVHRKDHIVILANVFTLLTLFGALFLYYKYMRPS
jgi:MtN3 and saliva related transmembrane protein